MSSQILFYILGGVLVVTFLATSGVKALREFSRHELEALCNRWKTPARLSEILKTHDEAALAVESLQALGLIVCGGLAWAWVEHSARGPGHLWDQIGLGFGLLVAVLAAGLWLPWVVGWFWAAPMVYYLWPIWRWAPRVLRPLVGTGLVIELFVRRLLGRQSPPGEEASLEEEIRTVVSEGHREGLLEADAQQMIEGVIKLSDAVVSKIMTPRTYVFSLPKSLSWKEMLELVVQSGHTRIPVYDRNRDDIVGILYIKDLLPVMAQCMGEPQKPWSDLIREPIFIPETKPVDDLLQHFQRTRTHMAVVLDEYGGMSGVVTLEDVLEEIVGEIADELDEDEIEEIRQIDERTAEVLGRARLDELNEKLALNLPENGEVETIGGLLFSELGRVPKVGDELVRDRVRFRVMDATHRRVERVRIELLEGQFTGPLSNG